jgi:hypothetical protein
MQPAAGPEADSALAVVPVVSHMVPWRVVRADPLSGHRILVLFVDGTKGEVDLSGFLRSPRVQGTVFEALRDPTMFARVTVSLGAVQWPNGADLAPDAMYDAIRESGRWVLE